MPYPPVLSLLKTLSETNTPPSRRSEQEPSLSKDQEVTAARRLSCSSLCKEVQTLKKTWKSLLRSSSRTKNLLKKIRLLRPELMLKLLSVRQRSEQLSLEHLVPTSHYLEKIWSLPIWDWFIDGHSQSWHDPILTINGKIYKNSLRCHPNRSYKVRLRNKTSQWDSTLFQRPVSFQRLIILLGWLIFAYTFTMSLKFQSVTT